MDFSEYRQSYQKSTLDQQDVPQSPIVLLQAWMQHALDHQVVEPYAMSLATADEQGRPSVRTVLVRQIDEQGLVFYTNYNSAKAQDISANPQAQVLFFWASLERQVRVSGQLSKLPENVSTQYFHKRPTDSQIAAWVSQPQSGVVSSRQKMEDEFTRLKQQYTQSTTGEVPRPEFWGGYLLIPDYFEFWQGRANRMHDRIRYQPSTSSDSDDWIIQRLLP